MEGINFNFLLKLSEPSVLTEGFKLMLIGMTIVFLFLVIMVVVMKVTAKILNMLKKYYPEEEQKAGKLTRAVENNEDIALVIATVKSYLKS